MEKHLTSISKYLSFVLRHQPSSIGLSLDEHGWAKVSELIEKTTQFELDEITLKLVAETNDKQRFAMDNMQGKIRANQGHSIKVNLGFACVTPPEILIHGTAERFIASIKQQGLTKQNRHHVHLSESSEVAEAVGSRYGKPVLLEINTKEMLDEGFKFYRSSNNVWLVESVPARFIQEWKS